MNRSGGSGTGEEGNMLAKRKTIESEGESNGNDKKEKPCPIASYDHQKACNCERKGTHTREPREKMKEKSKMTAG